MANTSASMIETVRAEPLWPSAPGWIQALALAAAAFLLAFPWMFTSSFSHHLMIMIFLYALMAQSWNVMAGFSGQISLGHAAFFGIGAYASSVLFAKYGITPWIGLLT